MSDDKCVFCPQIDAVFDFRGDLLCRECFVDEMHCLPTTEGGMALEQACYQLDVGPETLRVLEIYDDLLE